ncbi:nuclease-related domain-containing protein [Halobacteriovorax sp. RT-2-2]|uniref:nuclease-related domain-containing protein n=1 Tax=Halobacteriovorax sp. RT-2-2 TaxID=3391171 RepID=UPI0039A45803
MKGERKTALILKVELEKEVCSYYHDLIIPASNGTAQLDHVIVSKYGLFIIETKSLKG